MRILVAYDSKIEQVEQAAKQVGELARRQTQADVDYVDLRRKQLNVLAHYDKIVLGGGVWFNEITDDLVKYVWRNKTELLIKPLFIFFTSYHGEERFKQIVSKDLPLEVLEHGQTFNLGLNVEQNFLSPLDRIRWKLTGQKEETALTRESVTEFANVVAAAQPVV